MWTNNLKLSTFFTYSFACLTKFLRALKRIYSLATKSTFITQLFKKDIYKDKNEIVHYFSACGNRHPLQWQMWQKHSRLAMHQAKKMVPFKMQRQTAIQNCPQRKSVFCNCSFWILHPTARQLQICHNTESVGADNASVTNKTVKFFSCNVNLQANE